MLFVPVINRLHTVIFSAHLRFKVRQWIAVALLSIAPLSHAKTITVQTDRQVIEMGDVITLVVETDFQTTGTHLDLTVLEDQFTVLTQQRSNNIQIINGDFKSSTRWQIQLTPKQIGELQVPPLSIENVTSTPYTLTVRPVAKAADSNLEPFFLTADLSQNQVYVQQQVLYTLRFFYQGRFLDGGIRPPVFNHAQVTPISDQTVYTKQLNGQNYTVYEWVYALHPQKSGQLDIAPPMFNGQIQLQGRQKQVQIFAKPLSLNVLPEPPSYAQNTQNSWLPASQITLDQAWSTLPNTLYVGDTVNTTLTLQANGLTANQLPDATKLTQLFRANMPEALKIYTEQPSTQNQVSANGVSSQWQVQQTLMATAPGTFTLPERSLNWWNTQTNQLQSATIPAKTITILPAKNTVQTAIPAAQDTTINAQTNTQTNPTPDTSAAVDKKDDALIPAKSIDFWQIIALLALILWGVTLVAGALLWRKLSHKQPSKIADGTDTLQYEMAQNTERNTSSDWCTLAPNLFYARLRHTLQNDYGITDLTRLNALPLFKNSTLNTSLPVLINALEAHLFNQAPLDNDCQKKICAVLKEWTKTTKKLNKPNKTNSPNSLNSSPSQLKKLYGQSD
ncbi:BatD family protein [Thiomicrorhabdus aquaedulcis]|uniref:BatD family protein n=1 Tax=Thiomicrorhabdus aquaedulcis TaxID=2211106 RepID=UPI001561CE40|nr:BatD family protein [Thiomicrorhabdus aquaedulcis]